MVMKKVVSKLSRGMGQELAEYAVTLPVFLFIVFGIFDLGRVVYYYSAMQNAAREGARYGVVNPWETMNVIDRVKERSIGLVGDDITVSVGWDCELVTVHVDFYFDPVTPLIGRFFPPDGDVTISTGSEMQRERWDAQPPSGLDKDCAPFTIPPPTG